MQLLKQNMLKSIIHCYLLLILTIPLITSDETPESNHSIQLSNWVNLESDQSSLYFTFGNPDGDKKIKLLFDLINNESIVIESKRFNRASINNFNEDQLKDLDSERGILLQVDLSLSDRSDILIRNFPFRMKLRNEKTNQISLSSHLIPGFESSIDFNKKDEGLLSLSRSPNSFLSQLQASELIALKIISITKWGINFGKISFTSGNDHNIIKSPLIDYKNMWAINLFHIIIGKIISLEPGVNSTIDYTQYDKIFSINLPFVMDTYYHHLITLPYSFGHEFYNKYFINKMKDEQCQMVELPSEIRYECDCSSIRNDNLNFLVEGVVIELSNLELTQIRGKNKGCLFPILFKQGLDVAVLGRRFVKGFNVVLNDEDKTVGFPEFIHSFPIDNFISHDSDRNSRYKKGQHCMTIFYCIISIVLIAGIIVLGSMHMVYFK